MFPLNTDTFPTTSAELTNELNQSLRQHFQLSGDPVEIQEIAYPHLATIEVSLDGANLKDPPADIPKARGDAVPALRVNSFRASGERLAVGPAAIDFRLEAEDVDLHRALDARGNVLLLLQNASRGRIEISMATADLEALIAKVAAAEAAKHGVAVDNV